VNEYRLSVLAELDLADIADYTVDIWGEKQADLYLDDLLECFDRIAKMPGLGRDCHPGATHEKYL
jgi:toxin ParE1/3/4